MQLEFTADWGGIATSLVSAGLQYNAQRNNLKLEMAKLQAQQKLNQLAMQPPPAYPPAAYPPAAGAPAGYPVAVAPGVGQRAPTQPVYTTRPAALPSWAIPAGAALLGVAALVLIRR